LPIDGLFKANPAKVNGIHVLSNHSPCWFSIEKRKPLNLGYSIDILTPVKEWAYEAEDFITDIGEKGKWLFLRLLLLLIPGETYLCIGIPAIHYRAHLCRRGTPEIRETFSDPA
jgi:hypothetical protein